MEYDGLPTTGCNVVYNGYIDNYNGNTRSRYYFVGNRAVLSSRNTYTYNPRPADSVCATNSDLVYNPELPIYFEFISIILIFIALWLIAKTMWGFLFRRGKV